MRPDSWPDRGAPSGFYAGRGVYPTPDAEIVFYRSGGAGAGYELPAPVRLSAMEVNAGPTLRYGLTEKGSKPRAARAITAEWNSAKKEPAQ